MVRSILARADGVIHVVGLVFGNIGIVVLAAMMLLTVVDVFLRYAFNRPIIGGTEITQFMLVTLSFLVLVFCTALRAHVKVDILAGRLPRKFQETLDIFSLLFCLALCSFMAWYSFQESLLIQRVGQASDILGIPAYPFYLLIAITVGIVSLMLLAYIAKNIVQLVKR